MWLLDGDHLPQMQKLRGKTEHQVRSSQVPELNRCTFSGKHGPTPCHFVFGQYAWFDVHKQKLLCFEWSPPWHFKTACWHHFCLKLLSRDFCPTDYPNHLFHLAGHCACPPQWLCHLFKLIASNFATCKVRSGIAPVTLPHTRAFASNI